MNSDLFFVFCVGFFLFSVYMCFSENRRSESRQDRRDDVAYHRMLQERREFGTDIQRPEPKKAFKRK